MANAFTASPVICDGTMASTYWNSIAVKPADLIGLSIYRIDWYVPAAANDTYVIQDDQGNNIATDNCVTAKVTLSKVFDVPIRVADFKVTTLASGKLYIYFREG